MLKTHPGRFIKEMQVNKHQVGCDAQLARNVYSCQFFRSAILTHKVGQTDLVLARDRDSLVSICMQDCRSLLTSRHRSLRTQTAFWPAYMKSSVSWAKNSNTRMTRLRKDYTVLLRYHTLSVNWEKTHPTLHFQHLLRTGSLKNSENKLGATGAFRGFPRIFKTTCLKQSKATVLH